MKTKDKSFSGAIKRFFKSKTTSILMVLVGMCLLLGIANPSFFFYDNLTSVAQVIAYTAIFSFGELMVILVGGIDLSVGAICGLGAVTSCLFIVKCRLPMGVAIILAVLVGAAAGLFNALLVVGIKLPPFVATMATTQIIKSISLLLTNGKPVMGVGADFIAIGKGSFLKIPIAVWILLVVAIVLGIFLNKTVTGRRLYALGGNEEATRFSGINTKKLKALVYMCSGFLAGMAGIIMAAKLGSAQGSTGSGYESDAIASAVIGGASFTGGEGGVCGTIIGAAIMVVIRNALILLRVSTYWQSMIIGLIILVAVSIDQFRRASNEKVEKAFIIEAAETRK